jgi:hypothetical protein
MTATAIRAAPDWQSLNHYTLPITAPMPHYLCPETGTDTAKASPYTDPIGGKAKMITWIKRLLLTITIVGLIATNILTLTHTAFNAALSGLAGTYLGVRTVASAMQTKLASKDAAIKKNNATAMKRKAATRRFGNRLTTRTKRVAAKSIAAIPAEAIPFLGVAVLIADTSYELYAACETVTELDELYVELGMDHETPDDVMHSVCDPELPDAGEVWDGVVARRY